jgi:hypothetical protein
LLFNKLFTFLCVFKLTSLAEVKDELDVDASRRARLGLKIPDKRMKMTKHTKTILQLVKDGKVCSTVSVIFH